MENEVGFDTTTMSSKGQIVIPQKIRERWHAKEGESFTVLLMGDKVILQKIRKPSNEELMASLDRVHKMMAPHIKSMGLTEQKLLKILHDRRHNRDK